MLLYVTDSWQVVFYSPRLWAHLVRLVFENAPGTLWRVAVSLDSNHSLDYSSLQMGFIDLMLLLRVDPPSFPECCHFRQTTKSSVYFEAHPDVISSTSLPVSVSFLSLLAF